MNKALITLAVLGTFAGAAAAQSSVAVFGVLDVNGRYLKNGDVDTKLLANDGNSSSRLGFRGIEDLGNGLKAGFWLESSVAADTGSINSSGKFWHRRSTVSLISSNYGEVRLGRDTVPTWTAFADNDVFGTVGIADASRSFGVLGSNADTKLRADNLASYFLPANLGGIYGNVSVAPGEGVAGKKYSGGRVGYRAGPIDGSIAYGTTETSTGDFKVLVFGGSYDFGVAKVYASVQQTELDVNEDRHYTLGVAAPVAGGTFKASYSKADGQSGNATNREADQYAVGYVYDLSKRTALYSTLALIDNKGTANYTVADITGVTLGAGQKSQGFEAGIRHSF